MSFLIRFPFCLLTFALAGIGLAEDPKPSTVETKEIEPRWKEGEHGSILSLAVSPDGKQLATAGTLPGSVSSFGDIAVRAITGRNPTGGVQLRQLDNGKITLQVNNLLRTVQQVVYSPDGKTMVVACGDWKTPGQVVLLETATGKILTRFNGHSGWAHSVAFSPDGQRIVSGGSKTPDSQVRGGEAWLWDVSSGEGQRIWESDKYSLVSTAFSPDGRFFATVGGDRGLITLWDAATVKPKVEMSEHPASVSQVAFSPDGKTLVTTNNGWGFHDAVMIFSDVATGRAKQTVNATKWRPERRIVNFGELAFSPDGKYLAVPVGSWNRGGKWAELNLWNVEEHQLESEVPFAAEEFHPATATKFSVDGRTLFAAFGNGELKRWSVIRK